ncbi:hypothetical protein M4D58_23725 [Brevibacillus borstelensis]|uniref:hypothetical protein n=1 Tax=Brevibacillus borstelensis TaxID=45462 RepID=UPI002040D421|nr:hypothetical protein [Brevibacillus borstelensis]MCM3593635.1 hypothetical protein [Brevibacillus borstelensis]
MKETEKRTPVKLPDQWRRELEKMSEETGIAMSHLMAMATISMLINYQNKGSFIFADLLNPDHKNGRKE